MQGAKKATETMKETAANIGASAKSGKEKTKATVQEKAEKVTAGDPVQKEMATQKKEAKVSQAELDKLAAREHNAATKQSAAAAAHMGTGTGTGTAAYSTTGAHGQPMGAHQTSALPGHGTGHNTRVGGNPNATGYGTGGTYN